MWRFILVSFAFLGWAFYVLSGGSDYKPATGSLQDPARAGAEPPATAPRVADPAATAATVAPATGTGTIPPAAPDTAAQDEDDAKMAELLATLQASNDATAETLTAEATPPAPETGDARDGDTAETGAGTPADTAAQERVEVRYTSALEAFANTAPVAATESRPTGDFRQVVGSRVNLRSGPGTGFAAVDQLNAGTEVEVLGQEGDWLELRVPATGFSGWMSRRLVTQAQN